MVSDSRADLLFCTGEMSNNASSVMRSHSQSQIRFEHSASSRGPDLTRSASSCFLSLDKSNALQLVSSQRTSRQRVSIDSKRVIHRERCQGGPLAQDSSNCPSDMNNAEASHKISKRQTQQQGRQLNFFAALASSVDRCSAVKSFNHPLIFHRT